VRLGYRFENVGVDGPAPEEMLLQVRSPQRSILSVPFVQLILDTRDHPFDPKRGGVTSFHFEAAIQSLGTSANSSFLKLDIRQSWNFPMGEDAKYGVTSLAFRIGAARPTASSSVEMPLSERFFGGGPYSHRGVEPDQLGPFASVAKRYQSWPYNAMVDENGDPIVQLVSTGGQGIALVNFDYRFPLPLWGQWLWGEWFVDSGEVYDRIRNYKSHDNLKSPFPHWRTSFGVGLILRLGGFPIKVEYSWDVRRLAGLRDDQAYANYIERTRLKNLLVSAGARF
jgi:outer membrane protein assembly factor BamA